MIRGAVLVTGASGFVGLAVVQQLLVAGRDVIGFSATPMPLVAAQRAPGPMGRFFEHIGDIRDAAAVRDVFRGRPAAGVIHLSAITSGAAREPERAWDSITVNVGGLSRILQAAAESGTSRIVLASSVAVYGEAASSNALLSEDIALTPTTLYAITKATGEQLALRLAPALGLDCRLGRLGRVFGPQEYDTEVRDTLSQIYTVTERARRGGHSHLARPCIKNWQYAADAAASLVALLDLDAPRHRLYNLGTPHVFALADWCARLRLLYAQFTFAVGPASAARAGDLVDLGEDRDGGLLSWQRFATQASIPAPCTLDAAFADYPRCGISA